MYSYWLRCITLNRRRLIILHDALNLQLAKLIESFGLVEAMKNMDGIVNSMGKNAQQHKVPSLNKVKQVNKVLHLLRGPLESLESGLWKTEDALSIIV